MGTFYIKHALSYLTQNMFSDNLSLLLFQGAELESAGKYQSKNLLTFRNVYNLEFGNYHTLNPKNVG